MYMEAFNQGQWRGGGEFKLTKNQKTKGDPDSDFWNMAKEGRIPWICKDCLKNNGSQNQSAKKCECIGETVNA